MPVHCEGNHWVLAVINLAQSVFAVFDSMHSPERMQGLYHHMVAWVNVLNQYLSGIGFFEANNREPYNFQFTYNDTQSWKFMTPQQANTMDCGVIVCWLALQFTNRAIPIAPIPDTEAFFRECRLIMANHLYATRCEDTTDCGYD